MLNSCSLLLSDSHDQTGTVQRPRSASTELGALPAEIQAQKPDQTQGAQEEEREEGIHTIPSATTRKQGLLRGKSNHGL